MGAEAEEGGLGFDEACGGEDLLAFTGIVEAGGEMGEPASEPFQPDDLHDVVSGVLGLFRELVRDGGSRRS